MPDGAGAREVGIVFRRCMRRTSPEHAARWHPPGNVDRCRMQRSARSSRKRERAASTASVQNAPPRRRPGSRCRASAPRSIRSPVRSRGYRMCDACRAARRSSASRRDRGAGVAADRGSLNSPGIRHRPHRDAGRLLPLVPSIVRPLDRATERHMSTIAKPTCVMSVDRRRSARRRAVLAATIPAACLRLRLAMAERCRSRACRRGRFCDGRR